MESRLPKWFPIVLTTGTGHVRVKVPIAYVMILVQCLYVFGMIKVDFR